MTASPRPDAAPLPPARDERRDLRSGRRSYGRCAAAATSAEVANITNVRLKTNVDGDGQAMVCANVKHLGLAFARGVGGRALVNGPIANQLIDERSHDPRPICMWRARSARETG